MQIYLVGGCVRDKLLGLRPKDKDFVVVGGSIKKMLDLGYKQVGKDFPVFLHPKTKDEYALARIEKKSGTGYTGFEFNTKNVSLKDDLSRRDLTINSMAFDKNGNLIDYFGGENDLQNRLLKHTSSAFMEDPVRVLRIAKFHARFDKYSFSVAYSTFALLKQIVASGEVDNLVGERVFTELTEVLSYKKPSNFFKTLANCGAYEKIFALTVSNKAQHNNFEILDNLETLSEIKFAIWLNSYKISEIKNTCNKLMVPKKYKKLAILAKNWLEFVKNFNHTKPIEKLNFFNKTDSIRRMVRFNNLLTIFNILNIETTNIKKINILMTTINTKVMNQANIVAEIKQAKLKACS